MNLPTNIYFIGIGGIGMSALARHCLKEGKVVWGYDRTRSELCRQLEEEGARIHYADEPNALQVLDPEDTLVVYTPAIPKEHQELNLALEKYNTIKRSKLLGEITSSGPCIAVAGTHGKTTTSCMLAHIFKDTTLGVKAFLGGIASNYNTNYVAQEQGMYVAEADEYDRSFLQLQPESAIITSIEPDHLDIYGTVEALQEAFQEFAHRTDPRGVLVLHNSLDVEWRGNTIRYSFGNGGDVVGHNLRYEEGKMLFDIKFFAQDILNVELLIPGRHNAENAIAALVIGRFYGLSLPQIITSLASFKGVKRRFEYQQLEEPILIDDYAHHPSELRTFIESVKEMYPGKKVTGAFQPHLYSRTQDHMDEFATVLGLLDTCLLLPIYEAREKPIPGVTSEVLAATVPGAQVVSREELPKAFKKAGNPVNLTIGAGDIDLLIPKILQNLNAS